MTNPKTVIIVGARAYNATRLLLQRGYHASLLSGGAETWCCAKDV